MRLPCSLIKQELIQLQLGSKNVNIKTHDQKVQVTVIL